MPDPKMGIQAGVGLLIINCSHCLCAADEELVRRGCSLGDAAESAFPEQSGEKNYECVLL